MCVVSKVFFFLLIVFVCPSMAGWRDITRVDYDGALHKRQGIDPSGAVTYRPLRDWWSGSAAAAV